MNEEQWDGLAKTPIHAQNRRKTLLADHFLSNQPAAGYTLPLECFGDHIPVRVGAVMLHKLTTGLILADQAQLYLIQFKLNATLPSGIAPLLGPGVSRALRWFELGRVKR